MAQKKVKSKVRPTKDEKNLKRKKALLEEGYIIEAESYGEYKDNRLKPIINWLREGKTDQEIIIFTLKLFDVQESTANTYLRAAKSCFKQEMILERKFNIIQHVKRYDRDINHLAEYQPKTNSYSQTIVQKTHAYLDMINLLQKKEKVLGFHQKTNQVTIRNNVNIQIKKVEQSFSFDNLTWEEKLDLYNLISKTKIDESEKFQIKPNPKVQRREGTFIEDIVFEELPPPPPNINLIEHKDIVVEENHDEKDYSKDENVLDFVDKTTPRKNLEELKSSILGGLFKT